MTASKKRNHIRTPEGPNAWLDAALLRKYFGGQLEVENKDDQDGFVIRGEVEVIETSRRRLLVKFAWVASLENDPTVPDGKKWVKSGRKDYAIDLEIAEASNIGPSDAGVKGADRLRFALPAIRECVTLYPPNGSRLFQSQVEGF